MYMPWISYWNDGWFIWDSLCTVYSAWINGCSIRINDSAICRDNNACYITDCKWAAVIGYSSEGYLDYILLLQVLIGTMFRGIYWREVYEFCTANAFEVFDDYDTGISWMYAIDRSKVKL